MKAYPAYKESGVEWLGKIPEHWEVLRLKHVAIVNRQALTEQIDGDYELQYIDIGNVNQQGLLNPPAKMRFADAPSRARRIIQQNDTIISTVRTYLKAVAFIESTEDNLIASTGFAILTAKEKIYPKFLYYLVSSQGFVDTVTAESTGVSYPAITATDLAQISAWLPSLPEQQVIADFLDRKTKQIDALITKKQRQIDLLQEQRKALINQAVTKGLNPSAPLKASGVEWLGEIPYHWQIPRVKQVSTIFVPQRNKPELNQNDDGLPWITTEDLVSKSIGRSHKNYFVSKEAMLQSGSRPIPAGAVIASCVGRFGVSSVSECELVINQQLQAYIPENINPWFLHYYITIFKNYFEQVATASTLPYVNRENFGMLPITKPPLDEQEKIVLHIEKCNKLFDKAISDFQKQIELYQEYRTALISGAVTGKIDVRA